VKWVFGSGGGGGGGGRTCGRQAENLILFFVLKYPASQCKAIPAALVWKRQRQEQWNSILQ